MTGEKRVRVGELRPSQLMHTFGIGSLIDLPHFSVLVMGLDDWEQERCRPVVEDRLLAAVRAALGGQVQGMIEPPMPAEREWGFTPATDEQALIGVPVGTFPRWMRCPACNLLAPLKSGLFHLRSDPYRLDRNRYVHVNCQSQDRPSVVPARFLVACEHGHLDDFPWSEFVHQGQPCERPILKMFETGVSGEARDIVIKCEECGQSRRMVQAFEKPEVLGACRGRRPHLRDFEAGGCEEPLRAITLGASNAWFSIQRSALAIPVGGDPLGRLVDDHWDLLKDVGDPVVLDFLRKQGKLTPFGSAGDEDIWQVIQARQNQAPLPGGAGPQDLKGPEWQVLSQPDPAQCGADFQLREVASPHGFESRIERVVLVERLRAVSALLGFTRIESSVDFGEAAGEAEVRRVPLSRGSPTVVPAGEVRGEGIFLALSEPAVATWCERNRNLEAAFLATHRAWCMRRGIVEADALFPGVRLVLLHSLAHSLMRQLALESGYSAASIRERIYAADESAPVGPMAGILLYTAAADSDGTLGGLVRMGEPGHLERHLNQALEQMKLCSSDPLCAEHRPDPDGASLHGAACHACLFAPETSCEWGNRFLCRSALVPTVHEAEKAFFDRR